MNMGKRSMNAEQFAFWKGEKQELDLYITFYLCCNVLLLKLQHWVSYYILLLLNLRVYFRFREKNSKNMRKDDAL